MDLPAGTRLGRYEVVSKLGEGGMGEVYKARDTRLARDVAVKVLAAHLTDSSQARERLRREARAVAALSHPNICTIHDVDETGDGRAFLVMELLQGETLQARLAREPLDVATLVEIALPLADAFHNAHAAGIVHRDIKPANIFLTPHGPKILDFGVAKTSVEAAGSQQQTETRTALLTEPGHTIGTVAYMSPEQLRSEPLDARTDLFSFGLVLYEMATGQPAFTGATGAAMAAAILHDVPSPPRTIQSGLPPRLDDVILKAIEKDRGLRYQSASEIRADLQRLKRDADSPGVTSRLTRRPSTAGRWTVTASVVGSIVILVAVAAWLARHRAAPLTDQDTIVLADFVNRTTDPVFDDTLRQGLAVELQQSPFLSLVPDARIRETLALMGQPKDAKLTPDAAQQVCERIGSTAVLEGSIASLGSQYVLGLRARTCTTGGRVIDQEQIQASRREDVLKALGQIARTFRGKVGESLATVAQHSTPLPEATTSSLDALKAYSTGMKVVVSSGSAAAIPFFRRAIEIDPQFAMAYANLGLANSDIGASVLAAENTTKAWQLRSRVSDRERFFIEFNYDRQVTGNLERAYETLESWLQTYPRGDTQPSPQDLLGGLAAQGTGRLQRAMEISRKKIAADPTFLFGYVNLASSSLFLDRFAETAAALRQASEHKLEAPDLQLIGYDLAALTGDRSQLDRFAALANADPRGAHRVTHVEALALARAGRLRAARQASNRAADLALEEGEQEAAASYRAAQAVWEVLYGNSGDGERTAVAALDISTGRDVEYAAALALGFAGNTARADALRNDLEKRFPEDTFVRFTYAPVLRGIDALKHGKFDESIQQLQPALHYEVAADGLSFNFYLGGLYSAYVRGQALLALHRYAEAAAEFQKILNHRGIVGVDPIGALADVQLGRTFALMGDSAKADAAYRQFLALWTDADPDAQLLAQVRAERAHLN